MCVLHRFIKSHSPTSPAPGLKNFHLGPSLPVGCLMLPSLQRTFAAPAECPPAKEDCGPASWLAGGPAGRRCSGHSQCLQASKTRGVILDILTISCVKISTAEVQVSMRKSSRAEMSACRCPNTLGLQVRSVGAGRMVA